MTSFAEFFPQNPSSIFQNICAESSTYFDEILNYFAFKPKLKESQTAAYKFPYL